MQRRTQRRLGALVLFALLALLTACGGGNDSTSADNTTPAAMTGHNDADVMFAQGMIAHHEQAIEMAQMAVTKATSPDVVDLANQIQDAQQPEIDTMTGWLKSWDESADDMGGMDHSSMGDGGMAGMMTPEDMQALTKASGAEFDQMWLEMMIEHHEGAIDMAKTELADGESTDAKALAQDIIDAQQAEIITMKGLL